MKVLIASDIFPPQSGGPATYSVTLANELTKAGDDVFIVSQNPQSDTSIVNCRIVMVKNKNKFLKYLEYTWLLIKNARKAEVIYAMGPVNAGLPALIASKLTGKKLIIKIVGDYAWEQGTQRFGVGDSIDDFQKKNNYSLPVRLLQWIEKTVAKNSQAVVVPSKYLGRIVESWGVKKEKVAVIHNEVDYIVAKPINHENEKWIVSVGRLTSWKGMGTLIGIMPDLLKENSNLKLKIVGDGPMMNDLKLKIKNLNLENMVELTGNLPKEKALSYMASANIFVLNSGYEGYSHVLVEAMNQGVPVVLASRAGGNEEVVADPGLFEYNNKAEIKEKILANINAPRQEPKPHTFGGPAQMINRTRELLQRLCQN